MASGLGEATTRHEHMETTENTFDLTPEQHDTAVLLDRLLGKAIADRYVDFCRLAAGAYALRVSRPIAAHALRELESMLRHVLEAPMDAKASDTPADLEKIEKAQRFLREAGFDDPALQRAITALKPRFSHRTQIRRIAERLGLAPDSDIAKQWTALTDAFGRAHQRSFHRSLQVDEEFRAHYQEPFDTVIRAVAIALQGRYAALMRRVEELIAMPDPAQAAMLFVREIPGALPLQWYFFDKLQTPTWLPYLAAEGVLGEPLHTPEEANRPGLRFRQWPAGKYLLRFAGSTDPEIRRGVAAALRNVASSQHPDVQQQGLEIIAALPADEAAALSDLAVAWLTPDARFVMLEAPERLTKRLAEGNQKQAALSVARKVLQLWDQNGQLASLYGRHMYEYHLPSMAEVLTKTCGSNGLQLLVDLLNDAGVITGKFTYSHLSDRPIADGQSATYDVYDALVQATRHSAKALVEADARQMPEVIGLLASREPKIFLRLALHVLATNPAAAPPFAETYLTNPELIEGRWCEHEYAELALAWFPSLSSDQQNAILQVVDRIPDKHRTTWRARFEEHHKRTPDTEDECVFNAVTLRDIAWRWRAVLPVQRQETIEKITTELGDPDAWRHRLFPEEVSPMTGADFSARSIEDIVAFLRTWRPRREPQLQTITALAQELRSAATNDPETYAAYAERFADLRPIYVRRVMEGLDNSARNGRAFPWANVLKLIEATFSRDDEVIDPATLVDGDDANWNWACGTAADLLASGLRKGAGGISFEHARLVQALAFALLRISPREPEPEDFEARYARHSYFGAQATLRGKAVEVLILLVFWLSKDTSTDIGSAQRETLSKLPDVRNALNAELSDQTSAGRIPRAIIGRYLNWLGYFGEDWLRGQMPALVPATDEALRNATWLSHLGHDQGPTKALMSELRQCYEEEIVRLPTVPTQNSDRDFRENRLADYLLILHIWGALPSDLLELFWQHAPARVRQHAIWFLGTQLALPPSQLPDEMRARSFAYWERRLSAAETSGDKESYRAELGSIGQWCFRNDIDVPWLAGQLLAMLKAGFAPSEAYAVVGWIEKAVPQNVDRAIELLAALLTHPNIDHWAYASQRESIRAVLSQGLDAGSQQTIARAQDLIGFLSSVGETSYLDLIRPTAAE
jgi:hypothetical protein